MSNSANRKQSLFNDKARQQSVTGAPTQEMVKVAVLPPRLPQDMAPPTGIGAADAFSWQESLNYQHNNPINPKPATGATKMFRKIGLTTQREKANDLPNFTFREVPYDTWRKHYAKDKDGNYKGTHAPAEDCLLKPEDVAKWRVEPMKTKGDQWTRGNIALPVYNEVEQPEGLPEYQAEADTSRVDGRTLSTASSVGDAAQPPSEGQRIDGLTSEEVINRAKERHAAKTRAEKNGTWKDKLKRGGEMVAMGTNLG